MDSIDLIIIKFIIIMPQKFDTLQAVVIEPLLFCDKNVLLTVRGGAECRLVRKLID